MVLEPSARARRLLCALSVFFAFPSSPAEPQEVEGQQAQLDLFVNGVKHKTVLVLLRGEDVLVPLEDLEKTGLRGFAGRREQVENRTVVSLRSLTPLLHFEVDERELALRIRASQSLLGTTRLDLRPAARPAGLLSQGDPSAFLNYSAQARTNREFTGSTETGVSIAGTLSYGSALLLSDGRVERGLTNFTVDDLANVRRWIAGDTFASAGGLGGGALLGGLSVAKDYGLDPYLVHGPLPRLSGFASMPSTLDIYLNDVLVRQMPIPPGGYDLANLPVTAGSNNVRTVLRDAFGNAEMLSRPYYYVSDLLAPGFDDYGYTVGFRRLRYGTDSFDYGRPLLLARHRLGLSDVVTLGGRLEAAEDLISAGPSLTLALPLGAMEIQAAASSQNSESGASGSVAYQYVSRLLSGAVLLRWMSPEYSHASQSADDDRPLVQGGLSAGLPVMNGLSISADYLVQNGRDAGLSDSASLRADLYLAKELGLVVTGSRARLVEGEISYGLFATLSWAVAPATTADISIHTDGHGSDASIGMQRSLPAGPGLGFRGRASTGPDAKSLNGLVQAQWDYGRYELQYDRLGSTGVGTATAAGGLVFVGNRFFLTRPVQEGFALLRTGVAGVRGFLEGLEIGRTDASGDLLVPNLLPYYGNKLSIADTDVPIDYRIDSTEKYGSPTLRGGVVLRFDVAKLRTLTGTIAVETRKGAVLPAYGEITVDLPGRSVESPVGRDGRFYFEDLPAGRFAARLEWDGGRCQFVLEIPDDASRADVGSVDCRIEETGAATEGLP